MCLSEAGRVCVEVDVACMCGVTAGACVLPSERTCSSRSTGRGQAQGDEHSEGAVRGAAATTGARVR